MSIDRHFYVGYGFPISLADSRDREDEIREVLPEGTDLIHAGSQMTGEGRQGFVLIKHGMIDGDPKGKWLAGAHHVEAPSREVFVLTQAAMRKLHDIGVEFVGQCGLHVVVTVS